MVKRCAISASGLQRLNTAAPARLEPPRCPDEIFLHHLRAEIIAFYKARRAHDGRGDMVPDASNCGSGQQVLGGGLEKRRRGVVAT
jgi:hypothetical protein